VRIDATGWALGGCVAIALCGVYVAKSVAQSSQEGESQVGR